MSEPRHNGVPRGAALDGYAVIVVEGPDAIGFLQGQLTLDVGRLEPGTARMTAFPTAKGRVRALLRLCRDDGRLLAVLPAPLVETVAGTLARFVLRARVTLSTPALALRAVWGEGAAQLAARAPEGTLAIPPVIAGAPWLLASAGDPGPPGAAPATAADWERVEILAGVPEVLPATAGQFLPQMLGLDRLAGVSYAKGCYVGQEIIARAHHLGQVKRGLGLYRGGPGAAVAPGDTLAESGRAAGTALRVAPEGGEHLVLAVTRSESAAPPQLQDPRGTLLARVAAPWDYL